MPVLDPRKLGTIPSEEAVPDNSPKAADKASDGAPRLDQTTNPQSPNPKAQESPPSLISNSVKNRIIVAAPYVMGVIMIGIVASVISRSCSKSTIPAATSSSATAGATSQPNPSNPIEIPTVNVTPRTPPLNSEQCQNIDVASSCQKKLALPLDIQKKLTALENEFVEQLYGGERSSKPVREKRDKLLKNTGVSAEWHVSYIRGYNSPTYSFRYF